ncbi:MAG: hypothetical protein AB7F20_01775 [Geoalkalibacter sp.]|uniref:hypothetical protein n=1 Tax=Geoalkalibacter sp. TaxID=3041440 RepID=UPI003D0AF049
MMVQDKRNCDFAGMPPGEQPLAIVMVDSHDAVKRGGAVQAFSLRGEGLTGAVREALAPVRRHRSALQRGARKAQYASRNLIDSQGS